MKPLICGLVRYFKKTSQHDILMNVERVFIINVLDLSLCKHRQRMFEELEVNIEALLLFLLCIENIQRDLLINELERIQKIIIQRQIWKKRFDNPKKETIGTLYKLPMNCLALLKILI